MPFINSLMETKKLIYVPIEEALKNIEISDKIFK